MFYIEGLIYVVQYVFEVNGVKIEIVCFVDYEFLVGFGKDMFEIDEWEKDDWLQIQVKVDVCDIFIFGMLVWFGEKFLVCSWVFECMYGYIYFFNDKGQYCDYGKVGVVLIIGNEDGVKYCVMNIFFLLLYIGYIILLQVDVGWMGEVGFGLLYCDFGLGGLENDFINCNIMFFVWNCMYIVCMFKDQGGVFVYGNQLEVWDVGCKIDFYSFEYKCQV